MDCNLYDEMMSLHLDGLLPDTEVPDLLNHVGLCANCGPVWDALKSVDELLSRSASAPLAVDPRFAAVVMMRVAATPRAVIAAAPEAALSPLSPTNVFDLPWQEWQGKLAAYVRGFAAAGLGVAVLFSALLALVIAGFVPVDPALAPAAGTLRAFFSAADIWIGTLVRGVDTPTMVVGVAILSLVSAAGWQIVMNYYRSAAEGRLEMGHGEVVA